MKMETIIQTHIKELKAFKKADQFVRFANSYYLWGTKWAQFRKALAKYANININGYGKVV